jgi:ABC-type tungstate transport system permease subunit
MDEFQNFERLDADGDFEGGQWIGSEFVYAKQKKKAQQTEDDRLYGVFQGSSDEDEPSGLKGRKRRRQADDRELHKEVAFVSSGVVTETTERECDIHEDGSLNPTPNAGGSQPLL